MKAPVLATASAMEFILASYCVSSTGIKCKSLQWDPMQYYYHPVLRKKSPFFTSSPIHTIRNEGEDVFRSKNHPKSTHDSTVRQQNPQIILPAQYDSARTKVTQTQTVPKWKTINSILLY